MAKNVSYARFDTNTCRRLLPGDFGDGDRESQER